MTPGDTPRYAENGGHPITLGCLVVSEFDLTNEVQQPTELLVGRAALPEIDELTDDLDVIGWASPSFDRG
jgi:hypothetical protein